MEILRASLKPEFLNRIDEVVLFNSLEREQLRQIVVLQLELLTKRLADRRLDLNVSEAALDFIVNHGFDPVYGARPMKRAIQRYIQDPLAIKILEGAYRENERVTVDHLVRSRRAQYHLNHRSGIHGIQAGAAKKMPLLNAELFLAQRKVAHQSVQPPISPRCIA